MGELKGEGGEEGQGELHERAEEVQGGGGEEDDDTDGGSVKALTCFCAVCLNPSSPDNNVATSSQVCLCDCLNV